LAATLNTRAKQVEYKQRLEEYNRNHPDPIEVLHDEELRMVRDEVAQEQLAKRRDQAALRETYNAQLKSVADRKEQEQEEMRRFERTLLEHQQKVAAEEAAKREKQLIIRKEMREEYDKKNADLQQAREKRIAREKEEEKRLELEGAEIQKRRDERAAEDERRRLEKTRFRARVCDEQARTLAEQLSKQETEQKTAESATATNEQAQLLASKERTEKLERERHADWIRLQKEREARRFHTTKKPFPKRAEDVDADAIAAEKRRQESRELQMAQKHQVEERREEERKLAERTKKLEAETLETTKRQFDQSLKTLQTLVTSELSIDVPKYVPNDRFSK